MTSYETLLYDEAGGIATITLNRPNKHNAINDRMLDELDDVLRRKETDIDVKAIVIRGAGPCFSAGQDLSGEGNTEAVPYDGNRNRSVTDALDASVRWNRRLEYMFNYLKPIAAQVHGHCLGLGLYLALASDITIASEDAVLGDPSVRMGMLPGIPFLTLLIGVKRTKELLYLGRYIDGKEAEALCLITKAVPASHLDGYVRTYATALANAPADGMAFCKGSLTAQMEARGIGVAWRHMTDLMAMSLLAQQGAGDAAGADFWARRDRDGLKAALSERDAPVERYFPKPASRT